MSDKQTTGRIGEDLAVRFLREKGFEIIERNYRKKWGEIDIVAFQQIQGKSKKDGVLHFVEVKALRCSSVEIASLQYRPEDNVRAWKKLRLARAIRTYFPDRKIHDDQEFEVDVVAIYLNFDRKRAKIRFLQNVIFE